MIMTRGTAGKAVLSFAQQVSLSMLGTLAGTVVVTALKSEWTTRPATARPTLAQDAAGAVPRLTSGGKFAARALTGDDPEPFVIVTTLPPIPPLFTAAVLPPLPGAGVALRPLTATLTATVVPRRESPAGPAPVSARHPRPQATAPLPSHRDETAKIVMAPPASLPSPAAEDSSFWSRSRSAYQQVADWSDEIVDRLLP